mmetsp:Transcript_98755/g.171111  ORF Transcript_98755/g.171111 Transcript_98755/m.171111 type:complete len:465 (-) Transcript_98755:166-1560(-)
MINYDNGHQFIILLKMSGSVLPSCVPVGLATLVLGLALALIRELQPEWIEKVFRLEGKNQETQNYINNPFAIQTVAVVIGILLAMRTNMALGRWMDGISEIQTMLSKWCDAYNALSGFFSGKVGDEAMEERILLFRVRVAHWFSLMSCLAFATLRAGMLSRLEDVPIKELFAKNPTYQKAKSFTTTRIHGSFRSSNASADVGPVKEKQFQDGMSDQARTKKQVQVCDMDLFVLAAPSPEEISRLELSTDKVNCVCLWIVQGIITEIRSGTLDTPPPIVTRVFQELSNGMLGFNQAHKVAMVPFPFPFAQMVSLLLVMLYVTLPFYLDNFTKNVFITPLISFLLPMCYSGLNRIAIELEEPFGMDFNDVDIEIRHEDFLWALVDVLRQPTIPPVSENHKLEQKILRGVARGCTRLQEELEKEGHKIEWTDPEARAASSEPRTTEITQSQMASEQSKAPEPNKDQV